MDFSVASQVGLRAPAVSTSGAVSGTSRVAVSSTDAIPWYSPANPLTWVAGFIAVTFGLASVAGSVRLGKAKVSANVGKA